MTVSADGNDREQATAFLDKVIEEGLIKPVYQPIVDLTSERVVGYEALARGPKDSELERPDQLFGLARQTGRLHALDWACRTAAVGGALDGRLGPPFSLFVNTEPDVLDSRMPAGFIGPWATARLVFLRLMFEVTERALTERPAELLRNVARLRSWGWGIALDDVGADPRSLAMLPFVRPDVIKLDMRAIHEPGDPRVAEVVLAVNAEAERSGALILAEGIENEEHLSAALSFGAQLGQGWAFGRPEALPTPLPAAGPAVGVAKVDQNEDASTTPFELLKNRLRSRPVKLPHLLSLTRLIEKRAERIPHPPVLISAFQSVERFHPAASLYERLAARLPLVVAVGTGMERQPVPMTWGVHLPDDDPLAKEWIVAAISPYSAMMLCARELPDNGSGRTFETVLTLDRDHSVAAAALLMDRLVDELEAGAQGQRADEVSFAAAVAEAVAEARETEDLARPVLKLMARMTGLESTFLSRVTETDYEILATENVGPLDVVEGIRLPWPESVCKQALEIGRDSFSDVQADLPQNEAARELGFKTFVTCPVVVEDGKIVGTLCGASSQPGGISPTHVEMVKLFAGLVATHVEPARPTDPGPSI